MIKQDAVWISWEIDNDGYGKQFEQFEILLC